MFLIVFGVLVVCTAQTKGQGITDSVTPFEYITPLSKPKAVVLIAHGLNIAPEAMQQFVELSLDLEYAVVLLKLSGHRKGTAISDVNMSLWQDEFNLSYQTAKDSARKFNTPVYFIGFSLGGLLGCYQQIVSNITFSKQILLAPAIFTKRKSKLIKLFYPLGNSYLVKSITPIRYRYNSGTSVIAYKTLFTMEADFNARSVSILNSPTRVIMHANDELVSYKKIQSIIGKNKLSNWQMVTVQEHDGKIKHLLLDKEATGAEAWKQITITIRDFIAI